MKDIPHGYKLVQELNQQLQLLPAEEVIRYFILNYKEKLAFSTSLSAEDQVITKFISGIDTDIFCFTLDTGRMFPETYDLLEITQKRYRIAIKVFFPLQASVEKMVNEKGINLFYESVENRKLCCYTRKIEPLQRALAGFDFWISGLRREQSVTREDLALIEWDDINKKIKINPLIDWKSVDVWNQIRQDKIPYNTMHDLGFPSIGCQPCTRAVTPGEDIRAGRWWWENPEMKECGLHK